MKSRKLGSIRRFSAFCLEGRFLGVGLCLVAWCLTGGVRIGLCQLHPSPDNASGLPPTFDVAAAKVTPEERVRDPISLKCENGRLTMRNLPLASIVSWAFDVLPADLVLPAWSEGLGRPTYDIDAKANDSVPPAQVKLMLQRFLADRFHFVGHHEMREGIHPVLKVAKGGPKLKESSGEDSPTHVRADAANSRIICRGATLSEFLYRLWSMGNERIYDQTGLTGHYDFTLDYGNYIEDSEPEHRLNALKKARLDAIRSLGLDVVEARISIDTFVVDYCAKIPSQE